MRVAESPMDSAGTMSSWKATIRQRIWQHMEASGVAANPRPVHSRIPNFIGADLAAQRLVLLDEFRTAKIVKVDPDSPLKAVRVAVLRAGKMLVVPQPRLRTGLVSVLDPSKIAPQNFGFAATQAGFVQHGQPLDFDATLQVDLIVSGSVAINPSNGSRLGKGEGFADLEYGILKLMGSIDDLTPCVSCIHDCQIVDDIPIERMECYDAPVDIVCTPTKSIRVEQCAPKPQGIYWELLSPQKLNSIKVLQRLKAYVEQKLCKELPCAVPPTVLGGGSVGGTMDREGLSTTIEGDIEGEKKIEQGHNIPARRWHRVSKAKPAEGRHLDGP